jgi:hypothetical protein
MTKLVKEFHGILPFLWGARKTGKSHYLRKPIVGYVESRETRDFGICNAIIYRKMALIMP